MREGMSTVTPAEYLAKLKNYTEQPGSRVVNLIYGLNGSVVGNAQELMRIAELLLEERDRLKTLKELADNRAHYVAEERDRLRLALERIASDKSPPRDKTDFQVIAREALR